MNFDDNECKVCKKKTSYNLLVQIPPKCLKLKMNRQDFLSYKIVLCTT